MQMRMDSKTMTNQPALYTEPDAALFQWIPEAD